MTWKKNIKTDAHREADIERGGEKPWEIKK